MRSFLLKIYPGFLGLLIYATIRVIDDTIVSMKFWERHWSINMLEIGLSVVMGFLTTYALGRLFSRFDARAYEDVSYKTVMREVFLVFLVVEVIVNLFATPFTAFTDDGLSWGDLAIINIIPLLYCLIVYAIRRSNKLLQAYVNNRLQLEKIANDQLQTELKFLKAQYHPHFLFNALNTIYFQMDEDRDEAKRTVEKFSELLRYQLYDQQQMVTMAQELQYLRNFIDIQRVRSSERLQVSTRFDDSLAEQQVYPLLFLPLVENAFKYVGGEYRLTIEARNGNDAITFTVFNTLPGSKVPERPNGIGLDNLRRRLQLLYPGTHELAIRKDEGSFEATLKIPQYSKYYDENKMHHHG